MYVTIYLHSRIACSLITFLGSEDNEKMNLWLCHKHNKLSSGSLAALMLTMLSAKDSQYVTYSILETV